MILSVMKYLFSVASDLEIAQFGVFMWEIILVYKLCMYMCSGWLSMLELVDFLVYGNIGSGASVIFNKEYYNIWWENESVKVC